MVKLRLKRRGRKRLPIYDIVAADSRSPRDGRIIERIGQYNPLVGSGATMLDRERATYWLQTGAQPTDTVRNILSREGILLEMYMTKNGADSAAVETAVQSHTERVQAKANAGKPAPKKEEAQTEEAPAEAPVAEASTEEVEATAAAETTEAATTEEPATAEAEATADDAAGDSDTAEKSE